jgi:hypothetical protein
MISAKNEIKLYRAHDWFFGFKLHIVVNDKGEILDFLLTQGDVYDKDPLKNKNFHTKIFGKIAGD